MKKIYAALGIVSALLFAGVAYASQIPTDPARFETSLSAPIGVNDTSMSLVSGVLNDGSNLLGFNCFTIDSNQPNVEDVCGTANGSAITAMTRGISGLTGTTSVTALKFSHRRGADVKITDFPTLTILSRVLNQIDTLLVPIAYDPTVATTTFTNRQQIIDKGYADDLAFNGAGIINATTLARGIVQLATALQAAASTVLGSSGASLVLPSSLATSTYNSNTASNVVVMSSTTGRIDSNFIYPTTTAWPTANLASSTILANNGSGALHWINQGDKIVALLSSTVLTTTQTSTTSLYTLTIPANTISTSNYVRIGAIYNATSGTQCDFGMAIGTGSASTTIAFGTTQTPSALRADVSGIATSSSAEVWVSNTTGTFTTTGFVSPSPTNNTTNYDGVRYTPLSTAAVMYLDFNAKARAGNETCGLAGFNVELLSQ